MASTILLMSKLVSAPLLLIIFMPVTPKKFSGIYVKFTVRETLLYVVAFLSR
jgi:hypothetical protein